MSIEALVTLISSIIFAGLGVYITIRQFRSDQTDSKTELSFIVIELLSITTSQEFLLREIFVAFPDALTPEREIIHKRSATRLAELRSQYIG